MVRSRFKNPRTDTSWSGALRWACAAATAIGVVLPLTSAAIGTARVVFSPNDGQPEGLAALVFIPIVILELGAAALALVWIVMILRSRWRWPFFVYLAIFGALTGLFAADIAFVLSGGHLDTGGLIVTAVAGVGGVLFIAYLAAFICHGVWGTRPSPD